MKHTRILSAMCRRAMQAGLFLIALLGAAAVGVPNLRGATITVTNTNDSGAGSLRQALTDASDGDAIDFAAALNGQTIALTTDQLQVTKNVTISGPGADQLTIQASTAVRIFYIPPGRTVTIFGLTITNGNPLGISSFGGGIYNDQATLTLSNCTITGNSANYGGGIYGYFSMLTLNNCTIAGNSATYGGGISNYGGSVWGHASLSVRSSTISHNSAYVGGGIYNDANSSGSATLTINNSTISGNSASFIGGGIYNDSFEGNASLTIGHTILNVGASGENLYNSSGTIISLGYNLSSDDGGGHFIGPADQINTDPMLGPLQNNGGPTLTHALLAGSPAIDAGDPNFTPPPDYDQRGAGYPRVANGRIDIGAFEKQSEAASSYAAQIQPPINADGTSTFTVRRGVVPVKFTLTQGGIATCDLPPATIAVTRTAGGVTGQVNESVYSGNADTGSNFRIDSCQYVYNLNAGALGAGTYRVDMLINAEIAGSVVFQLR